MFSFSFLFSRGGEEEAGDKRDRVRRLLLQTVAEQYRLKAIDTLKKKKGKKREKKKEQNKRRMYSLQREPTCEPSIKPSPGPAQLSMLGVVILLLLIANICPAATPRLIAPSKHNITHIR